MLDISLFSQEELGLYNPAFTGFILLTSINEFFNIKQEGMHCALSFVILPMAMNQSITSNLPTTLKTPIASWVFVNEGLLSDFADQAACHNPIVRAAISFLLERKLIVLSDSGHLFPSEIQITKNPSFFKQSQNISKIINASKFLGKWFANAPSTETIFAQLGIRP